MGRHPSEDDVVKWVFHEGHCVCHTGRASGSEGARALTMREAVLPKDCLED